MASCHLTLSESDLLQKSNVSPRRRGFETAAGALILHSYREEIPMHELLTAAAVWAVCYLEGLNGRGLPLIPPSLFERGWIRP